MSFPDILYERLCWGVLCVITIHVAIEIDWRQHSRGKDFSSAGLSVLHVLIHDQKVCNRFIDQLLGHNL